MMCSFVFVCRGGGCSCGCSCGCGCCCCCCCCRIWFYVSVWVLFAAATTALQHHATWTTGLWRMPSLNTPTQKSKWWFVPFVCCRVCGRLLLALCLFCGSTCSFRALGASDPFCLAQFVQKWSPHSIELISAHTMQCCRLTLHFSPTPAAQQLPISSVCPMCCRTTRPVLRMQ